MKLTIGMASYNNFLEVWFTIQSLIMYHDLTDVELLIVDNYGDDVLRDFINTWLHDKVKYVRYTEIQGTAAPRNKVFEEATGEWVFCIDSHIMIKPGAIDKLKEWIATNPDCKDLLQGPMLYDDQKAMADAFNPIWDGEMWGTWRQASVSDDQAPYEIEMQGLGLFGCRRDAWLGFSRDFRGFGGEEGYIHEKYRQNGNLTLCLPFLKWLHFFHTRNGKVTSPYAPQRADKIRNYEIGFNELGLDASEMYKCFGVTKPKIKNIQIDTNAKCGSECWYCPVRYIDRPNGQTMPQSLFESILDSIDEAVKLGSVDPAFTLWLSSYNDVLLDLILRARLQALRERNIRFTCLTNGIGLLKNVDLLHEYKDVIAGYSVNLPAGNSSSYADHTNNKPELFETIISGLVALYNKDPEHYHAVVSVCINGAYNEQTGLKYKMPFDDTETQKEQLGLLVPFQVHAIRPLADRAGHLKPFALDNGIDRISNGCNCNGNRLTEWLHINSFGEVYTCCQDYEEKTKYADLNKMSVHEVANLQHNTAIQQTKKELCRFCAFGG